MPTYFSLAEFLRSDTAAARNIDNTPSWEVVDHLRDLADNLLDPLRVAWGKAIRVTSGYRKFMKNKVEETTGIDFDAAKEETK